MYINDLASKANRFKKEINSAAKRVIDSGWYVLGNEVNKFEELFSDYLKVNHCIGVANGTDAIELALRAMDVSRGSCVATVANAGMYSSTAILAIGAEPYFIDVDIDTKMPKLSDIISAVQTGVDAVIVTHLYGHAVPDIYEISEYCKDNNIPLLEDCAQAHGAQVNDKFVGAFGDVASFSFYPTKNLGALGDGGAVVTNSADIAAKCRMLRQYGWNKKYSVCVSGGRNSRLDELQAAILIEFLPYLDQDNARRRKIATRYSKEICHPDVILPAVYNEEYIAHLYVIRCKNRENLQEHLRACDISTDIHYPIPDYHQLVFGDKYSNLCLRNTETLADQVLTLPCYPEMNDIDIDHVITSVNTWRL